MSTKEKLLMRFRHLPADFTFDEVVRLFALYGFKLSNRGGTSGSRVAFIKGDNCFMMHRPHPGNVVKKGTLKGILEYLDSKELLKDN